MARMIVTYFDLDDVEMQCCVNADDEAAALGVVLDELGDSVSADSPFAVWRERTLRRRAAGARKGGGGGQLLSGPEPRENDDDLDDGDEDEEDDEVVDGRNVQPLPEHDLVTGNHEIIALFAELKGSLGVKLEPEARP